MNTPFLLSDRPISADELLLLGFQENVNGQFKPGTVWFKRGKTTRGLSWTLNLERVREADWRCVVSGLVLTVRNCQDVVDIINVLEK